MFDKFNIPKIVKILTAIVIICFGSATLLFVFFCDINNVEFKNSSFAFTNSSNTNSTTAIDELKTNPISGIDSIKISNAFADVSMQTYDEKEIKAHLYGHATNTIKLDIKKAGSKLIIDVITTEHNVSFFSSNNLKLDIQIPKQYKDRLYVDSSSGDISINSPLNLSNIKLESSSGNINSPNLIKAQEFDASASSGNISIDNVACNKSNVKSTSGTIRCKGINSKINTTFDASSGDIHLENVTSKDLAIETTSGLINAKNILCGGYSSFRASSGDIGLNTIKAKDITIETTSGTVKGDIINADSIIDLSASSGDMTLDNVKGNVKSKSTSGNVKVYFSNFSSNNININTSSGDAILKLPENSAFTLNTKTSSGNIKCAFPVTISSEDHEHSLNGVVCGGQNIIGISTSSGNISIIKK